MDVLFLNHNVAWSGGTFFRAFGFARELVRLGHRVTLVTISPDARLSLTSRQHDGVEVVLSPDLFWGRGRTGWDPWDVGRRLLALRGRQWHVVHAWDSRPVVVFPALYAAARSRAAGGRLIMDWCDWWGRGGTQAERTSQWMRAMAPVETLFEERFRNRTDGTTVISEALRERAIALGVNPERILLLPQGCDVSASPGLNRDSTLEALGLDAGTRLIISVGALNKSDAALLFGAVRRILRACERCHFVLIGKHGSSVPPDLASHPRVRETGFVSAAVLNDYVRATHALLAPLADTRASRARWPSKINGFLAAGRAVVTTRIGDLAALLERERAAVVVNPNEQDVCDGVLRVLSNATERERVEREARRVAETLLAWSIVTRRLETFYRDVQRNSRS